MISDRSTSDLMLLNLPTSRACLDTNIFGKEDTVFSIYYVFCVIVMQYISALLW